MKTSAGAEPDRPGVVAAVDPASDLERRERRNDGEAGGDDAEPEHGQPELERPVGCRDPDDQDQRLGQRDVREERDQQAIVDVVPLGRARARLLVHRRIVSRARTRLGRWSGLRTLLYRLKRATQRPRPGCCPRMCAWTLGGERGQVAACKYSLGNSIGCQSMIPKSGSRFSEKIMLKQEADHDLIRSNRIMV